MAAATPSTSGEDKGSEHAVGSITGGPAADAAPIGGPVLENVFPNLSPAPGPASGAAMLKVTTVVGTISFAGVVGSFILL
ncbi:hypothetical protein ACS0TY_009110 [Phlomoides rotata]